MRIFGISMVFLIAAAGLAGAQGSGQYVLTQPTHPARVNKVEGFTVKQKVAPARKSTKKLPKATTRCLPVGTSGVGRAC
jgi:hypothetical protein